MKNITLIFVAIFLSFAESNATPQSPDKLIYKGDTIGIYPFILDKYIYESPKQEYLLEKLKESRKGFSTACWRGHIALFEIRNDSLFLMGASSCDGKEKIDLSVIFGKRKNIFVDWFTGTLTHFKNNIILVYDGWGGYYEYETDFIIEKGILKDIQKFHNDVQASIYANTSSDTLLNFIKSNINYKNIKPVKEKVRVMARIDDVDDNGKISKVTIIRGHEDYNEEAIRVIKSIPKWQIIKRRGKKEHIIWMIPVLFEPQD